MMAWDKTLQQLEQQTAQMEPGVRDRYVGRFHQILQLYAGEISRDLQQNEVHAQSEAAWAAGTLQYLLGNNEQGKRLIDVGVDLHVVNAGKYSRPLQFVLKDIAAMIEEFSPQDAAHYQERLKQEHGKKSPGDRREEHLRTIRHIEADMECTPGDLDEIYRQGRTMQAGLYQKLGDHRTAIGHYNQANVHAKKGHMREHEYVKNTLAIIDCHLELGEPLLAQQTLITLLNELVPPDTTELDRFPEQFARNYKTIKPYCEKLEVGYGNVIDLAERIFERTAESITKKKMRWTDLQGLTMLLATHYTSQGQYQKASDIIDRAKELSKGIESKPYFSRTKQASYLIAAGDAGRARQLLEEEEADRGIGMDEKEKTDTLAQLYLRLGDIDKALDLFDTFCVRYKRSLAMGSYSRVREARERQLDILKKVIGVDYLPKVREFIRSAEPITIEGEMKVLAPAGERKRVKASVEN